MLNNHLYLIYTDDLTTERSSKNFYCKNAYLQKISSQHISTKALESLSYINDISIVRKDISSKFAILTHKNQFKTSLKLRNQPNDIVRSKLELALIK